MQKNNFNVFKLASIWLTIFYHYHFNLMKYNLGILYTNNFQIKKTADVIIIGENKHGKGYAVHENKCEICLLYQE